MERSMDEEFAILMMFFGISVTANLALAVAWFRSARRAGRYEKHFFESVPADERRVEQLEHVLDSVAGQVAGLASGQEFLNRVLGERAERAPERLRMDTPH
jgi:hypothetical protein